MAIRELEVDREESEQVVCPSCQRPLWLSGERSMPLNLRNVEIATTDRVVSVVVTGAFPMIFAKCACGDVLQIKIRHEMFIDRSGEEDS